MSKIKRVLLIAPMVVCLFGLSSIEQQANSNHIAINKTVTENINPSINPSVNPNVDKKGKEQEPMFVDGGLLGDFCGGVEVVEEGIDFGGFGSCTYVFVSGSGCGLEGDQSCISSSTICGGRISYNIQCDTF